MRTVPRGQVVIDEPAAHLAAYPSGEWLFTTRRGEPLTYRYWKTVWRQPLIARVIAGGASVTQVQAVLAMPTR